MQTLKIYSVENGKEVLIGEVTKKFNVEAIKGMIADDSKEAPCTLEKLLKKYGGQKVDSKD